MNAALIAVVSSIGTLFVIAIVCVPLAFKKTKPSPKVMKQCPTCNKWSMQ